VSVSPLLNSAYVSYAINPGTNFDDLWVKIDNFSDPSHLTLATGEDGLYHVGKVTAGTKESVYYYLT